MKKSGFTIIEVVVVFLLILSVTFLVLPKSLNNTKQARLISQWAQKYSELEYMFTVIKAQRDSELKEKFNGAKTNDDRKNILLETLKPYLRITSDVEKIYTPTYMNGNEIHASNRYHFNNFYYTSSNEIVGLKWINENCKDKNVCAIISFDINGLDSPNRWGYDIFGINVFKTSIEPMGKGFNPDILRSDCDKRGSGIYCSYYYLIGGRFD